MTLRTRALGSLFFAGATIGLVSLLLAHPPGADLSGLWSNVGVAYLGAVVMFGAGRWLRTWMIHVALLAGLVLITRAVVLSRDPVSFYSVWFIWVALYALYFFDRLAGVFYVLLAGALYAATLVHDPPTSAVARWLTTFTTLVVAGGFIDTLVNRSQREAKRASASARRMGELTAAALELAGLSDAVHARSALCEAAANLTGANRVVLWEFNATGSELHASAGDHAGSPLGVHAGALVGALRGSVNPAGAARAFSTAAPVWTGPGRIDPQEAPEFASARSRQATCLWQPIGQGRGVLGVLALLWKDPEVRGDDAVRSMCELVAVQAKVTLERLALLSQLELVARTDELTGLPNRRAWEEALPRELNRASRSPEPLCVAVLDLDHFKIYNDTHGHQAGDKLLKEVAASWTAELRAEDMLARYGGEEFTLVLPGCPLSMALEVIERLSAAVPAGQSCSAGVALWQAPESAPELLDRADRALYEAKGAGRGRAIVASPAVSRDDLYPSHLRSATQLGG